MGPVFHKVPFHISFEGECEYQYVIDHKNNYIEKRRSVAKGEDKKSERSRSSNRRIFSEKKKDQNCHLVASLSPIEMIKSKEEHSFEREFRKHKIFGDYSTINSNEGQQSQQQIINKQCLKNQTSTPFVLVHKQAEPTYS